MKSTPVAYTGYDDLPQFVLNLLDQYDSEGLLTWGDNNIPQDEIWVKVGGDHGGEFFKFMLQIANTPHANSRDNTILITIVNCKDSFPDLKQILKPFYRPLHGLEKTTEKKICTFLFGDYDFLQKIYGLSGAQAAHPCLWCKASKHQTKKAPNEQPAIPSRSVA